MKKKLIITAIMVMICIALFGLAYKKHNQDLVHEKVNSTIRDFGLSFLSGDAESLNKFFTEDAIFVYKGEEIVFASAKISVAKAFKGPIQMEVADFQIGPENELRYRQVGDTVMVKFEGFFEVKDSHYAPKMPSSLVFKRDDNNEWKITRIESDKLIFKYYFLNDEDTINQVNEEAKAVNEKANAAYDR